MPPHDDRTNTDIQIAPDRGGRAIRQAMVLAAGLGERMRPLTDNLPKPMLPVAGTPIIDRILDYLENADIERTVVNTHYLPEALEAHLAARARPRITISREETCLDTGGGIARAMEHFGGQPFFAINGDTLWLDGPTPTLDRLEKIWDGEAMDALLMLHGTVDAYGYQGRGDFVAAPDGRLSRRPEMEVSPYVFTGTQILHPRLFEKAEEIAGGKIFSMNVLYDKAIAQGRLFGMIHDGEWFHIGTPEALDEVETFMHDPYPGVLHRST